MSLATISDDAAQQQALQGQQHAPQGQACIAAIGIDAGMVNMGIGCIRFYGVKQLVDDDDDAEYKEGGAAVRKTIPHFDIMAAERWDVTRGIIHRPSGDFQSMEHYVADPPSVKSNAPKDMANHITRMVPRCPWLFEAAPSLLDTGDGPPVQRLPSLVIENQSDFVDRAAGKDAQGKQKYDYKKAIMGPLAENVATAIRTVDAVRAAAADSSGGGGAVAPYPKRERVGAMSKYGLRCDASRDRPERKEEAVDAFLELLSELGTPNALRWFHWFTKMEAEGEQIHDVVDALSLVVQACFMRYQKHGKQELRKLELKQREEIRQRRELLNSIRQVPTRPKKGAGTGTKKAPKKAAPKGGKQSATDIDMAVGDAPSAKPAAKRTRKPAAPKKKKNNTHVTDGSSSVDMPSGDDIEEMAVKPKTKSRKQKTPAKKQDKDTKTKPKRKRSSASDDDGVMIVGEHNPSADPIKKKTKVTTTTDSDVHSKYPILLLDEPLQH